MTTEHTTDHAPEFAAADRTPIEELGWFRRWVRRYTDAFSVARSSIFWVLLRRQRRVLKWFLFAMVVNTVTFLLIANLTRGMVDNGIVNQTAPLWDYVRYIAFWASIGLVLSFAMQQLADRMAYQIEFDLRAWLYTHVQSAELRRLDQLATGQLVTRSLTDIQLIDLLLRIFPTLIGAAPLLLALAIIVTVINPFMGIISILAVPLNVWLLNRFRGKLRALSWAELNERAEVATVIDEPVRGIRVVKAFGREEKERSRVGKVTERAFRFSMTRARLLAHYEIFLRAAPVIIQAMLLAVGAYLMSTGRLTVGTFLLAFQIGAGLNLFSAAFGQIASAWQYLRGAQDRLAEMLALSARPVTDGRMIPLPSTGLELRDVEVTYGARRFLRGFDLRVGGGELVVVSGPPGCGKTTLAGIASGLTDADRGTATLEGVELSELDPNQLRQTIRVVSEEPLLLAATLRDNLLLGAWGEIDDDRLHDAMRVAGAEDVVEELGGLDGVVGDRGLTVSGGQRQRVSLARALVAKPRVLILDDALSAVNPSLEVEIMQRVRQYLPDTAILYITRRSSLDELADRSLRLEPPEQLDGAMARAARVELLDDSAAAQVEAATAGTAFAAPDAIDALDAIDQAGMEADVAEGISAPATAGLAAIDPVLADLVHQVEVTDEQLDAPDELVETDEPPRFRTIAAHYKTVALCALLFVVLAALGGIAPELLFGRVTDIVQESDGQDASSAYLWALALVGVGVATGFAYRYFLIFANRFTQSVIVILRRRVFRRLTRLGVNYYDRELPGDVATRVVADLDRLLTFAQEGGFRLISFGAIFVVAMGAVIVVAPGVTLTVFVMLALMVVVTLIQLPFANRALTWSRQELGVVTRKFHEDFSARHEIRHLGAEAIQTKKFVESSWERRRARWWVAIVQNTHGSVLSFLGTMTTALVLYQSGTLVLEQQLTIGAAVTVQLLATTAAQPLLQIPQYYNQLLDVRVSWQRLCEPFAEPIFPEHNPAAVACPRVDGPVTFESVEFTYPDTERPVLRDVSFTMEPGRVTALVGYTGAGKSSIAKLLSRTYDPDGGAVKVNGIDLRDVDPDSFRPRLGIVPQDPFVFRGTVASNIRYSSLDATDAEVEAAVRAVGAWDLLAVLPGGLDHPVEEEGHSLTAAQRQLVALARAWLAQPDILVLDEATSLLDTEVEDVIIAAVHELECTTLMITHREAVAAKSDFIVVLQAGQVVDSGPETEVARPGSPYDALWRIREDELAEETDRLLAMGDLAPIERST